MKSLLMNPFRAFQIHLIASVISIIPVSFVAGDSISFSRDVGSNCGLACLASSLKWLGCDNHFNGVLIDHLAKRFGSDHPYSLYEIARILQSQGISVKAFDATTLSEACSLLDSKSALILAVDAGDSAGHFVFLYKKGDLTRVIDYPHEVPLEITSLNELNKMSFKGAGLILSPSSDSKWNLAALRDESSALLAQITDEHLDTHKKSENAASAPRIELSNIDKAPFQILASPSKMSQAYLMATFAIFNDLNEDVTVEIVKADCGCFRGADHPQKIPAGTEGVFNATFSSPMFKPGSTPNIIVQLKGQSTNTYVHVVAKRNVGSERLFPRSFPASIIVNPDFAERDRRDVEVLIPVIEQSRGASYKLESDPSEHISAQIVESYRVLRNSVTYDRLLLAVDINSGKLIDAEQTPSSISVSRDSTKLLAIDVKPARMFVE